MPPWRGSTPKSCSGTAGKDVGRAHEIIVTRKQALIERLVQDRGNLDGLVVVDVLLALADARSQLGQWIRGDEVDHQDPGSVASFVFVGEDALRFLGGVPSYPGLVVLVVDHQDEGVMLRLISGAPDTEWSA